ncbi:unannotated protein [freshwater metagenome]|uniref:Unannotated protein n=1 Tax=freshwater metagenome TaxID=449393 RepID=A0A6J6Q561_9ZZZZ
MNRAVTRIFLSTTNGIHVIKLNAINWCCNKIVNRRIIENFRNLQAQFNSALDSEQGDVPGWVLVVLMTTGLVTGIWTVAQPRLSSILKNSLDNMNSIR